MNPEKDNDEDKDKDGRYPKWRVIELHLAVKKK